MSHPLRRSISAPQWPSFTGTSQYVGTSPAYAVAVYVDPSLGAPALQNAKDLLADADRVVAANNAIFGAPGDPVSVIVFALGGQTDGTGGADHDACNYTTGGAIEVWGVDTLARAIGLVIALERGELDDLPILLQDRLHEPYRAPLVPGLDTLRNLCGDSGCLGVTISGSGPAMLLWCRRADATAVAERASAALLEAGVAADVSVLRVVPGGIRARWVEGPDTRLAKAVG